MMLKNIVKALNDGADVVSGSRFLSRSWHPQKEWGDYIILEIVSYQRFLVLEIEEKIIRSMYWFMGFSNQIQ